MAVPRPTELKMKQPSPFNGDREETNRFIQDIGMYLIINEEIYNSDKKKIAFLLSFMQEGTAGPWKEARITTLLKGNDWGTYTDLVDEIRTAFAASDSAGLARAKLRVLRQTTMADEYIAEFRTHSACSGITQAEALIEYFMEGLRPAVLEKVIGMEECPVTIEEWYTAASKFDNNWRRGRAIIDRYKGGNSKHPQKKITPRYVPPRDPNAMDIDRLSTEDRDEHMKKGLCFECHQFGHRARECKGKAPANPSNRTWKIRATKTESTPKIEEVKPDTGRKAYAKIRAMLADLDDDEKEVVLKSMEDEGF